VQDQTETTDRDHPGAAVGCGRIIDGPATVQRTMRGSGLPPPTSLALIAHCALSSGRRRTAPTQEVAVAHSGGSRAAPLLSSGEPKEHRERLFAEDVFDVLKGVRGKHVGDAQLCLAGRLDGMHGVAGDEYAGTRPDSVR
jgi:hypothetical protein